MTVRLLALGDSVPRQWMLNLGRAAVYLAIGHLFVTATVATAADSSASTRSVLLSRGSIDMFHWQVLVHRDSGERGWLRPCIEARSTAGSPWGSSLTLCGAVRRSPILFSKSEGAGRAERTVLVIAYKPQVTAVRLWLEGHRSRLMKLRMLTRHKAVRARVTSFRYAVLGVAHHFCLLRLVAYDSRGRVVEPKVGKSCPASGSPRRSA